MTLIALTRVVSPAIERCELTHIDRTPVDFERACTQHGDYEGALEEAGCTLHRLAPLPEVADAVFVEDTAIVFDDYAIIARPGAESRRGETPSVEDALARWRRIERIESPGTLDGGDVVTIGDRVFVGESRRTNAAGILQLTDIVARSGLRVVPAPVKHCLHLKSAVTRVGEATLLINPAWTDRGLFEGFDLIAIDPSEPFAANAALAGDTVIYPRDYAATHARLRAAGLDVLRVPADELAKAEGGVSCCSLIFSA